MNFQNHLIQFEIIHLLFLLIRRRLQKIYYYCQLHWKMTGLRRSWKLLLILPILVSDFKQTKKHLEMRNQQIFDRLQPLTYLQFQLQLQAYFLCQVYFGSIIILFIFKLNYLDLLVERLLHQFPLMIFLLPIHPLIWVVVHLLVHFWTFLNLFISFLKPPSLEKIFKLHYLFHSLGTLNLMVLF